MVSAQLLDIYDRLLRHYGPQHWWPAQSRVEMIVGAILTQSVGWSNVERAIANLRAADALEPAALYALPIDELARYIRPSGYYNVKARKVKAFVEHLHERYRFNLDEMLSRDVGPLRDELLTIHGVGPETADSIILYAAHRPVFVIDAYTRRLLPRLGLASDGIPYDEAQSLFENNLPHDAALFNEYHALIVIHSKNTCKKRPLCTGCPLAGVCTFGQR